MRLTNQKISFVTQDPCTTKSLQNFFFDSSKFTPISNFEVTDEITRFNKLLSETIEQNLSTKTVRKLAPKHTIMDCYGTVKLHKSEAPLRPICTGYKSMLAGTDEFLAKTFGSLLNDSKYEILGPGDFKKKVDIENFAYNPDTQTVLSFDVKSLFTQVKVGRVISYLLKEFKKDPHRFFEEHENNQLLAPPKIGNLRIFLHKVLTDFNFFRTEIGVFKQTSGLGMGTSLSPLLAKLFMSVFEREVVDKLIKRGLVLKWHRYVDDVMCILKTSAKEEVFHLINKWDSQLKFTQEEMGDDGLIFLDCRIFYEDGKLKFIKYRKFGTKTVLTNFALSVTCQKSLTNSIFGMLHRERDWEQSF